MFTRRIIPTAQVGARAFSSTLRAQKTLTESAKDTAQDINLKVGKTLAAGIETAEGAAEATKQTLVGGGKEAAQKAGQAAEVGKRKANEAAEVGKQKANETSAQARGKTEELRQKGQKELGS